MPILSSFALFYILKISMVFPEFHSISFWMCFCFHFKMLCTISRELSLTVIHNSNAHEKSTVDLVPVRIHPSICLFVRFVFLSFHRQWLQIKIVFFFLLCCSLHKKLIYVDSTQFSILIFFFSMVCYFFRQVVAFFSCSLNSAIFFFFFNWKQLYEKTEMYNKINVFSRKKKRNIFSLFICCLECKIRSLYIKYFSYFSLLFFGV